MVVWLIWNHAQSGRTLLKARFKPKLYTVIHAAGDSEGRVQVLDKLRNYRNIFDHWTMKYSDCCLWDSLKPRQGTFTFVVSGGPGGQKMKWTTSRVQSSFCPQVSIELHPLSSTYPGSSRGGIGVFQTSSRLSRGIPRPDEMYNPLRGFWVCPRVSREPPKGGVQERSGSNARTTNGVVALIRAQPP